jgi:nucleolar complex protein 2
MKISSSAVHNAVMMFMLREADDAFVRCLGLAPPTPEKPIGMEQITKSHRRGPCLACAADCCCSAPLSLLLGCAAGGVACRWRKVGPLVKSYLGNTLHALSAMTDPPLTAFTLRRLRASAHFMTPQPLRKFADKLLKVRTRSCGLAGGVAHYCCTPLCAGCTGLLEHQRVRRTQAAGLPGHPPAGTGAAKQFP